MDQAARGTEALKASNYSTAVSLFTEAIEKNPAAVDYYLKRATAYQRSTPSDCAASLADAEVALALAVRRAKYELITQAQMRRAIALFGLGRWADAGHLFALVKKRNEKETGIDVWIKKVQTKLEPLAEDDEARKVTIKDIPDVEVPEPTPAPAKAPVPPVEAPKPVEVKQVVQTPPDKIKHDWYQSNENVYFTLLAKGVPKEKAVIDIQPRSLTISFPTVAGSTYDFSLDPFFETVDPSQSTFKITPNKVEVILRKSKLGIKWDGLEGSETSEAADESMTSVPRALLQSAATAKAPSYPTSSRSGPKDWDKVASELTKKPPKEGEKEDGGLDDLDDEGGDEVNAFFKKLYANADPDTRRAMIKSYQESNGTALSTNWSDVSKGPVETTPPDGMEARKWGT